MTKEKFINELQKRNINPLLVCWEESVRDDVFCVWKNYNKWVVYYQERGKKYDEMQFETESEALEYLLHRMI